MCQIIKQVTSVSNKITSSPQTNNFWIIRLLILSARQLQFSVSSVLKNQVQFFHDFPTAEKEAPPLKKGTNQSKSLFITCRASSRFNKVTLVQSFSLKWSTLDTIYYTIIQRHKSYEEIARFCG